MTVDLGAIQRLVAKCESLPARGWQGYNESNTRKDFIEPLFEALGWDVRNKEEVDGEKFVRPGFADYAFIRHGMVRFYLESKKLEEDLDQEEFVRQVITYAYSRGVSWAVLCNFSRLVVFDAQEEMGGARPLYVLNLGCGDYVSRPELLSLLTPESILEGRLTEHAVSIGVRRRPIPIEKRLYAAMRQWREDLFNDMSRALGWKKQEELRQGDEAIQRLLDRLIFLRNCEDRGIGEPGLRALRNRIRARDRGARVAESLGHLFSRAAATYYSELFETNALIDLFLLRLGTNVDETLERVIEGMYAVPKSYAAYDFSLIDADVLGQVYEQYLGHVAQQVRKLAAQAPLPGMPAPDISVEEKRQRRKEHGIYYTPTWVVDYIVGQTVGSFLTEHADDADTIANVKILDPACGSCSFLIRAYEALLEHHAGQMGGEVGHLDRQTREWILRHNIFGVDVDPQAVEIARLNLLMRMVREEEALPPLRDKIRLGNSLISGGEDELQRYFGRGWREKQPFAWEKEFRGIAEDGGFDVVIGNPPYVRIQTMPREEAEYYRDHYESAHGAFDLYVLFVEQGLKLLKDGGLLGFITSGKFLKSEYGKSTRTLLYEKCCVRSIVDLSDHADVFGGSTSYPVIMVVENRSRRDALRYVLLPPDISMGNGRATDSLNRDYGQDIGQDAMLGGVWPPPRGERAALMRKLEAAGAGLGEVSDHVFQGLITSADRVYTVSRRGAEPGGCARVYSRATGREYVLEDALLHPLLQGKAVNRYHVNWADETLIFPYDTSGDTARLIPIAVLQEQYPLTHRYLEDNRSTLQNREKGKMRGEGWHGYSRIQNMSLHGQRKLVIPRLVYHLEAAYDPNGLWYLDNVDVGGVILKDGSDKNYKYVLGLLNSRLLDFYFRQISAPFRGQYRSANRQFISPLPIKQINPNNKDESRLRAVLVTLVEGVLKLKEQLATKEEAHDEERARIQREIEQTDRGIDDLVYDLYGMTREERAIVEDESRR
ncbi:MAG: N-6 DNA methylase [Dehalococcoidia bacterium]|nr:N-6 DNA methylase [Dehalococcoidia bacterium]